jgi:putative DNA primase/helicase
MPDDDIRLFLQRYFGYCLTGDTGEQVIVMFWGKGSNGKSTLMDMMNWLLGDYALVMPFASLLSSGPQRGSDASPDFARLPGCRFLSSAEPDTGARFSESVLKQLTGGEKLAVRHLHKDFFEMKPQFKLCLSFNNKPYIRGQDEGIWRRILLVPFTQSFADPNDPAEMAKFPNALPKILNIEARLREEASGILNWMLDGYRMWLETGLDIPGKVRAATATYRHESNPVHQFVASWCEIVQGASVQASRLYEAYQLWCRDNAMDPVSQTSFGRRMSELKFERDTGQLVFYRGLMLGAEAEARLFAEESKRQRRKEGNDE